MRRSAKRHRKGRSDRASAWLGVALISFALVCACGLVFVYFGVPRAVALEKESLCPLEGAKGVTAVLVDTSDDLPATTKRELTKLLLDSAEGVAPHELLDIRVLDAPHQTSQSIFARCNPGDGAGLSEWTANPALARKRWLESFRRPVEDALSGGLAAPNAKTSPIMAAIQSTAVERFTGKAALNGSRKLIVVSDLIEYEPDYSQYNSDLSFQRYRNSLAYRKYSTNLQGADVVVYYVQRLGRRPIESAPHIRFWTEWFRDNNGRLKEAVRLQGAG